MRDIYHPTARRCNSWRTGTQDHPYSPSPYLPNGNRLPPYSYHTSRSPWTIQRRRRHPYRSATASLLGQYCTRSYFRVWCRNALLLVGGGWSGWSWSARGDYMPIMVHSSCGARIRSARCLATSRSTPHRSCARGCWRRCRSVAWSGISGWPRGSGFASSRRFVPGGWSYRPCHWVSGTSRSNSWWIASALLQRTGYFGVRVGLVGHRVVRSSRCRRVRAACQWRSWIISLGSAYASFGAIGKGPSKRLPILAKLTSYLSFNRLE